MKAGNEDFLTEVLIALGLLILCALGYKTIAWFRQDARGSARREDDALLPFREAFEAGEISREELDRVRQALQRQAAPPPDRPPAEPPQRPGGESPAATHPSTDSP
jgi:hypothetical protein